MTTSLFIYIIFGAIIAFDIYLAVRKKKTISEIFRRWYKGFPFVAYAVGAVFIGHFGLWIDFTFVPVKIALGIFIIYSVAVLILSITKQGKIYNIMNKIFLIPMAMGAVVGCLWM